LWNRITKYSGCNGGTQSPWFEKAWNFHLQIHPTWILLFGSIRPFFRHRLLFHAMFVFFPILSIIHGILLRLSLLFMCVVNTSYYRRFQRIGNRFVSRHQSPNWISTCDVVWCLHWELMEGICGIMVFSGNSTNQMAFTKVGNGRNRLNQFKHSKESCSSNCLFKYYFFSNSFHDYWFNFNFGILDPLFCFHFIQSNGILFCLSFSGTWILFYCLWVALERCIRFFWRRWTQILQLLCTLKRLLMIKIPTTYQNVGGTLTTQDWNFHSRKCLSMND
jgi:hypothetical protein